MACPRCGCRMISKQGRGETSQLICADCGLDLTTKLSLKRSGTGIGGQFVTIALITVFGITAMTLMAIKDHRQENLNQESESTVDLNQPHDTEKGPLRWIIVPRLPDRMAP